jgi:hypothetical protein
MPKTLRSVLVVLGVGVLLGVVARSVQEPSGAALPVAADPPASACAQQSWPNIDRRCLSWTLARDSDAARIREASEQAGRAAPSAQQDVLRRLSIAQPLPSELQPSARAQAVGHATAREAARASARASARAAARRQRLAERRRNDAARTAAFASGSFDQWQVSGYAAEARRRSRIRPTNPQDAYYYAQRPSWQRPFSSVDRFRSGTR